MSDIFEISNMSYHSPEASKKHKTTNGSSTTVRIAQGSNFKPSTRTRGTMESRMGCRACVYLAFFYFSEFPHHTPLSFYPPGRPQQGQSSDPSQSCSGNKQSKKKAAQCREGARATMQTRSREASTGSTNTRPAERTTHTGKEARMRNKKRVERDRNVARERAYFRPKRLSRPLVLASQATVLVVCDS